MSSIPAQEEIINTPGNMIVCASAGTGKTYTMVSKIEKEIKENNTHRVIAAITFTIKAAKEIRNRLNVDVTGHFIGTNNSFVIEEIIKPFAKDVYGGEYDIDMSTDYSIKEESFSECMERLKNEKIICSYNDNKKNFVFELAMEIVKQSKACRLFLEAKYFKIFVDEYQDCDKDMHTFFMYLCDVLKIDLFVVGDEKQSIYIWRGAYPEAFISITKKPNFIVKKLHQNFRSCKNIQNYSNLLDDGTREMYEKDDNSSIILLKTTSTSWVNDVRDYLDASKTIALLRFSNNNAKIGADELSQTGIEFIYVPRTPLSEVPPDVSWLFNAIAQYMILSNYSVYDFIEEIPEESINDNKVIYFLNKELSAIEKAFQAGDNDKIYIHVREIASYFGYNLIDKNIGQMIDTINDETYHPAFRMDELSHVAITFHASKGLEYDQVILFSDDYSLDESKPKESNGICNHYVAATRAKSKLIIIALQDEGIIWKTEKFMKNLTQIFKKSNVDVADVLTIV